MVEHLVIGLKTSPNHIGSGSALETGGWQFIDQHGHMRLLNKVNLSGFHRSQAKGSLFVKKICCRKCKSSSCREFLSSLSGFLNRSFDDFPTSPCWVLIYSQALPP
ncbi:hypothetical protein TNCV_1902191 [Trichonephila clavipes]|nr:hypothetical protein TNCV_1902191 [Trichonephila clavipes]